MKEVAVIGAGASGLAAVKCCLDEGLEPTCYEVSSHIGGLWHYTDTVKDRQACVIKSTIANVSKEMMCYSDFPPAKECPIYMHNTDAYEYFQQYADHFKLLERIMFNTEVVRVEKSKDFDETGQWDVTSKNLSKEETKTKTFDAVMVCTGVYSDPHIPWFPGEDCFKGKVMHSHQYRTNKSFEDQRVLVVGLGNTAGDIACDLSMAASKVFVSSRQGAWMMSRIGKGGSPYCMQGLSRFNTYILNTYPGLGNKILYNRVNKMFDHDKFSLRPTHPPIKTNGFINDDLPSRVVSGKVELHADIKRFTETGVEFIDGLFEDNIDAIILATGYRVDFPFLDKSIIGEDQRDLYKAIFPPDLKKNTLAFIGSFRMRGPIVPVVEMQSRCATRVFTGDIVLPSREDMWVDIERRKTHQAKWFNPSLHYTLQVDYIPYADELGQIIGCKPQLGKLFTSDPKLAMKVLFGPCTPYQQRLTGPGSWSGAREAIMTQWKRTYYPVNTRRVHNQYRMESSNRFYTFLIVALVAILFYLWL